MTTTAQQQRYLDPDELTKPFDDTDTPLFTISVAAELSDMHPQTLRTYEREGLIEPGRTQGNTRRYSRRDVDKLKFIRRLTQEEGLNLAGVRVVLEMGDKLEGARQRIVELEDVVRALADRLKDDVDAAHKSHRFEIIPAPGRDVEVHERLRRRPDGRATRDRDPRASGHRGDLDPRAPGRRAG